ncbi:hypothetical protein NP233_g9889 [Leucocoprinus birnbaumii]|uniref:Fungal-type protein kinase domain-containing protein n=1 Tax=Leucocoprinus birnbaumii TaxID=56174 RepID=A0AAD5VN58_9AGAR|nr:hypothetical protein NP233_g9889 [Leucocoprinus birnbaumii]
MRSASHNSCPVDVFLKSYAPFEPSTEFIDEVYAVVREKCLVETQTPDGALKTTWADFPGTPSSDKRREEKVFLGLENILRVIKDVEPTQAAGRQLQFSYKNSPYSEVKSENAVGTFKWDGCIRPSDVTSSDLIPAEAAVVAEFKKSSARSEVIQNRKQLVSAASQIMHDDPRRMFTYGITIEDQQMSLWYFDRSHSVKSDPFDFTQDFKTFVRVFVSFLWATEHEIGFDPTVHRVKLGEEIRYVYQVEQKFFLTQSTIHNPRLLSISGRTTRVWEVVQVAGTTPSQVQEIMNNGKTYALKDVWLDENAPTERAILDNIFGRLKPDLLPDRQLLPESSLWGVLEVALDNEQYKKYFMEIVCDQQGDRSKPILKDAFLSGQIAPDPDILDTSSPDLSEQDSSRSCVKGSTQEYTSQRFFGDKYQPGDMPKDARSFGVKRQYRLVYADVGQPLRLVPNLGALFQGIHDAFIALALMMLANWVHRDVSTGNIILIEIEPGKYAGKLSDLEYGKEFNSNPVAGSDPKTGTAFFMPFEVHKRGALHRRDSPMDLQSPDGKATFIPIDDRDGHGPPFYRFDYDLESIFWIIVWALLTLIQYELGQTLSHQVFTYGPIPSHHRTQLFENQGLALIVKNIVPLVAEFIAPLQWVHLTLFTAYKHVRRNHDDYLATHSQIWKYILEMQELAEKLKDKVKFIERVSEGQAEQPLQTGGKRQREDNTNVNDVFTDVPAGQGGNEAGTSQKRHRSEKGTAVRIQDSGAFSHHIQTLV